MQTNAPWNEQRAKGRRKQLDGQLGAEALDEQTVRSNFPRWLRFVKRNDENANDIRTHELQLATARVHY